MKAAGFWVSRHLSPDQLILSPAEIDQFNTHIKEELKLTKDIFALPAVDPEELINKLQDTIDDYSRRGYYFENGRRAGESFFKKLSAQIPVAADVSDNLYGLVVGFTDLRILPADEKLLEAPEDIEFDQLQNSAFDIGTPVKIFLKSEEQEWVYVRSALSEGWIKAADVAFAGQEQVQDYSTPLSFAVITAAKADVYEDAGKNNFVDYARMGAKYPFIRFEEGGMAEVLIPGRADDGTLVSRQGFIDKEDLSVGHLPYTARNIIEQAFKLLNHPYGWGGMEGEQDCSRFLVEIFSTVGVVLPRDSGPQRETGTIIAEFSEKDPVEQKLASIIDKSIPGITVLGLDGHIMLYLGAVDSRAYAIHAAWAYREPSWPRDRIYVVNRVAVTDLSLGENTRKGSWLRRIISINHIQ